MTALSILAFAGALPVLDPAGPSAVLRLDEVEATG